MTAKFNIRRNVVSAMLAFAINLALVFVSYRLVVATGGLQALGLWSSLMAWIFVIRLGDVGMATAVVRFVARCDLQSEGMRIRQYVDTALLLNILLFLLLALLGYAVYSSYLTAIVNGDTATVETARTILPLMFTGFFLSNISGQVLGGLTGVHRGYQSATLGVIGTVIQLIVVVWGVPRIGLAGLAWGLVCQHAFLIVAGWILFVQVMRESSGVTSAALPLHFSPPALREMIGFSLSAQFANLLNGLLEPISKILIGHMAGLDTLGLYEMAFKMVSLPRNALVSGVQATTPSMTRLLVEDPDTARRLFERSERRLMRAMLALSLAIVAAAPLASWFLLGHIDMRLWLFVCLLIFGFIGNVYGAPAYILSLAAGRTRNVMVSASVALILAAACGFLGGLAGGAVGNVAGVATALICGGLVIRVLGRRIWE